MNQVAIAKTRRRVRRRPSRPLIIALYLRVILHEFRWTLLALSFAVLFGGLVYSLTRDSSGRPINASTALYGGWMALLAQPIQGMPQTVGLMLITALYPVFGLILIGEGIVRLALLMVSRREGEKEWMKVMASTYDDHVILCGLGHLGIRVLEQLVEGGVPVVVLEKSPSGQFIQTAKAMDVPVLIRNMRDDEALIEAGVTRAAAILICTNDDMANLEVALDSRRLNPRIRVVMRLFEQQLASKIAAGLNVDAAFSSSSLAAPLVAALSVRTKVLSTTMIGGVPHVVSEVPVEPQSALAGQTVQEVETEYRCRVLARSNAAGATDSPATASMRLEPGDTLIVHAAASQLAAMSAAAHRAD